MALLAILPVFPVALAEASLSGELVPVKLTLEGKEWEDNCRVGRWVLRAPDGAVLSDDVLAVVGKASGVSTVKATG